MADPNAVAPWHPWHRVTPQRWVRVAPHLHSGCVLVEMSSPSNGREPGEDEEDTELTGSVRFDGCANLYSDLIHLCSAEEASEVAACIRAAYSLAAPLMASWCGGEVGAFVEWVDGHGT